MLTTLLPALLALSATPALADYLGPRYVPPRDLTSDTSYVARGFENFTSTLELVLAQSQTSTSAQLTGFKNLTFSLGMFSLYDEDAATQLQYHHASNLTLNATYGTKEVNGDSIYRIASVTKVFSVYAALLTLDPADWNRPLTEFFPELADAAKEAANDGTLHVHWDRITPIGLASQISGVPRDSFPFAAGELTAFSFDYTALGFPPLDPSKDELLSTMPCRDPTDLECGENLQNYIESVREREPTFAPWNSPAYANTGYILFGQVLEKVTGKSIDTIFAETIFEPLGMNDSSSSNSSLTADRLQRAVIPGDIPSLFTLDYQMTKPSGGVWSTINDLSKAGISILNNTLLTPEATGQWMKPHSHTARLGNSVGAPWEIVRYTDPETAVVTDIYTKSGEGSLHSGWLVLIPDFDVGFSILAGATDATRTAFTGMIGDLLIETIMPALSKQARAEAERNFAGTYASTTSGLNSSITIAANNTEGAAPGLVLTSFISNGTDMLNLPAVYDGYINTRLVPTIVDRENGKVALRAVSSLDAPKQAGGWLSALTVTDWVLVGSSMYGGYDLNLYVFDIDANGKATSARPSAFRVDLQKSSSNNSTMLPSQTSSVSPPTPTPTSTTSSGQAEVTAAGRGMSSFLDARTLCLAMLVFAFLF